MPQFHYENCLTHEAEDKAVLLINRMWVIGLPGPVVQVLDYSAKGTTVVGSAPLEVYVFCIDLHKFEFDWLLL